MKNLLTRLKTQYGTLSKGTETAGRLYYGALRQSGIYDRRQAGRGSGGSANPPPCVLPPSWGYGGYPEFHRALEELVINRLNSIQRMEVAYGRMPEEKILDTVLQSDIDKIKLTLEQIDREAFRTAVEDILQAETIYVVGDPQLRAAGQLSGLLSEPDFRQRKAGDHQQRQRGL